MNKKNIKRLIVIAIIIILLIIATIYFVYNDVHIENYSDIEFTLDTEFKYKISIEINSNFEPMTQYPVLVNTTRYYQMDLENNIVELREDSIPTLYYKRSKHLTDHYNFYKGKMIDKKELTGEESEQLKQLLEEVIRKDKTTYQNREIITYYFISSKNASNIVMDNVEDISIFKEIIDF